MIKRALNIFLIGIVLASSMGAISAGAQIPTPSPAAPARPLVVQIQYSNREQLDALATTLDIWEVHPEQHMIVAQVWPEQYDLLVSTGVQVSIDEQRSNFPETIPNFPCYRTIAELYARLDELAASYPGLVQLVTIGHSYENRPLQVVKITNKSTSGVKPRFFLMANIHGRELITPEAAMVFIEYLTGNYGSDADVTWLLDYHEIYVLVSANPDGHVKNESMTFPGLYWRKNTNPTYGCLTSYGVDLNRNHSFKWGMSQFGSSDEPCDDVYRGPSPASESEVAAIQSYVSTLFPDQRGPNDSDAAPDTATGVLISLHSYSNLVLWPWGWEQAPAPNAAQLTALGKKFASYNSYSAKQAVDLYTTDGTTDDWSYGELGIASYTFEMGTAFYQSCDNYDSLIQPNIPALIYAAKVARTPYITPQGPDALNLTITPAVTETLPVVSAAINDSDNGNNLITGAEYYIDQPPWAGGTPVSMLASDGAFNQIQENVEAELATSSLGLGRHTIFVRGRDNTDTWGPVSAAFYTQFQLIFLPFILVGEP